MSKRYPLDSNEFTFLSEDSIRRNTMEKSYFHKNRRKFFETRKCDECSTVLLVYGLILINVIVILFVLIINKKTIFGSVLFSTSAINDCHPTSSRSRQRRQKASSFRFLSSVSRKLVSEFMPMEISSLFSKSLGIVLVQQYIRSPAECLLNIIKR